MVELHVDAAFGHGDAFGFEEFALKAGIGFADEEFAAGAEHAMPGNAFARGTCSHGMTGGAGAATKAQSTSNIPVS